MLSNKPIYPTSPDIHPQITEPTTTSTAMAMLNRTARLVDRVPEEIWEEVLSHLVDDRETLRAVVQADVPASGQAQRLYWRNDMAAPGLVEELNDLSHDQQQGHANVIRQITMSFRPTSQRRTIPALLFPQLREITVMTTEVLSNEGYLHVEACVGRLLGPRLQCLDVGSQRWWHGDLLPSTDNFLPALSSCSDLRDLTICARVEGASSQHLITVLKNCKELKTLYLSSHTAPLIDHRALEALATHRSIEVLDIDKVVDQSLASVVITVDQPFRHLVNLTLNATPEGASTLLPQLERLKTLWLVISGSGSVFPALGRVDTLQSLSFESESYPLTDHDLLYLTSLKQLESLHFHNGQQNTLFNQNRVSREVLASVLSRLPKLQALDITARNSLGDDFVLDLGRACRSLQFLSLTGDYTLKHLSSETSCLFPSLDTLQLGKVKPSNPQWREDKAFSKQDWADSIAKDLARHAPKLRFVYFCFDEKDDMAQMAANAWWFLKDKKDYRTFLEKLGTKEDEIALLVSEFTPVSG